MCRKFLRKSWILAVVMGLALASLAAAQTVPTPASGAAKKGAKAELATALKSAHRLLLTADHDYKGHRAKAAEEVALALRELSNHRHKAVQPASTLASTTAAVNPGTVAAKKPAHGGHAGLHESQVKSDAQMLEAQQILQGVLAQTNVNHPKFAANIKAALAEINMAIAIR